MDIFESLEKEWRWTSRCQAAQDEARRWGAIEPVLRCHSVDEVVSRVAWAGYRPSGGSAAVLSALLRLAGSPLAARALLQALLPRIRIEKVATPTYGHGLGESWPRPSDTAADLVAECFASIKRHAGEHNPNVDRLVVREGARRLRTARQGQRRWQCRTVGAELPELSALCPAGLLEARSGPEWLAAAVLDAVRAGALDASQARLLYAARVKGVPASEVGRCAGLAERAIYYALAQAERALVASLERPLSAVRVRAPGYRPPPQAGRDSQPTESAAELASRSRPASSQRAA
jgi:hypothetical protein